MKLSDIIKPSSRTKTEIIAFLNKLKEGELLTSSELSIGLKKNKEYVKNFCTRNDEYFENYSCKIILHSKKRVWGNKKTITYLKKKRSDLCVV